MTSEQESLKKILENKGKAPIQLIAKQVRISNAYARLICVGLIRKGLVKQLQTRDWYQITAKGKRALGEKRSVKKKIQKKIKDLQKRVFHKKKIKKKTSKKPKPKKKSKKIKKSIKKAVTKKAIKKIIIKFLKNLFTPEQD